MKKFYIISITLLFIVFLISISYARVRGSHSFGGKRSSGGYRSSSSRSSYHGSYSGGGIEEGTDLPTVFQPNFEASKRAFLMRHPNFNPKEFAGKVRDTFMKRQHAWSTCNREAARPLETDYLFSMHKYWIEQYKAEGMRNILEDIEIHSITFRL